MPSPWEDESSKSGKERVSTPGVGSFFHPHHMTDLLPPGDFARAPPNGGGCGRGTLVSRKFLWRGRRELCTVEIFSR